MTTSENLLGIKFSDGLRKYRVFAPYFLVTSALEL